MVETLIDWLIMLPVLAVFLGILFGLWKESRVAGLEHTTYFFGMVLDALKDNMPALAQEAEQHAGTITQSAMRGLFSNTDPNTDPKQSKSNSNDPVLQRATPVENEVVLNAEIVGLKLQIEGLKRLIASNPVAYRALTDDIPKGVKVAKEGLRPRAFHTVNIGSGRCVLKRLYRRLYRTHQSALSPQPC